MQAPTVGGVQIPRGRGETVRLPRGASLSDFADRIDANPASLVTVLFHLGEMVTATQSVSDVTLTLLGAELNYDVQVVSPEDEDRELLGDFDLTFGDDEGDEGDLSARPPVVTVMGHVDHGKTRLLDAIRQTHVAEREAGGITQHIGAYQVQTTLEGRDRLITFIDTPGHEAFTAMRARGAQVTDIAIIVVAADDGVMPQTREAIDHVRAARVPMIVAINKIDRPDANPDRVKQELADMGVLIEEYGGDVIAVQVSAKQRTGLEEMMEMVLLVADLQDLKADPSRTAIGTIVESKIEKGRGTVATVLLQTGTLNTGDVVVVGRTWGKVRALQNAAGIRVTSAGPATAVEVLGLNDVPQAGDILRVVADEKTARDQAGVAERAAASGDGRTGFTLEDISARIQAAEVKELRVVLKTDVQGSLGAIRHALERLNTTETRINIIREGAGDINESDVLLASASDAVVIGFNARLDPGAQRAVEASGVDIRLYDVIYKLTDDIEAALRGMLAPKLVEQVEGHAEVRMVIKAGKAGFIAGSYVTDGRIVRGAQARLFRAGKLQAESRIETLRRFKDDVREVGTGFECGIGLGGDLELAEGDIVECFQTVAESA